MKHLKDYISYPDKWIFVVIKPGFLNKSQIVIEKFKENGWKLSRTLTKQLLLFEAKKLYKVHKKEEFYDDLCKYMASGLSMAMIFRKSGKMSREMFDETNKIKDELRKKYAESDMRNFIHSSDSLSAMEHESSVYF